MSISRPGRMPRRLAFAGAATLTAVLTLSACAGSPDAAPSGSSSPVVEKDLAIAAVSGPNSLDPAQLVDGQQMFVWSSILDTLLAKENNTGELIPNAAESWEYNEDGTELTLKLREGMTFSSGDPVNADAVVTTMLRNKNTPGIVQVKYGAVSDVTAEDDLTVVVHFTHFDPQFLANLAQSTGAIGDPATIDDERTATDPVGSGPFTLDTTKTVPGSTYVLNKRDDYWNADAIPFKTFTVRVLQDPTASFNALQAGEINAGTVQTQLLGQLGDEYAIQPIEAQAVAYLDILDRGGEQWPCLGDQRVRQAINYAIDREGVLEGLFAGVGKVTEQVFSPFGQVYDEELNETYDYDPEKGAELVEEAGCAGESFQIPSTFLSTSLEPTLTQAFADIGLTLEWVPVPPQQAQSAHLSGDYPLSFQITGFNSDPADAASHYSTSGYSNPRGYTDPTIDALFETINTTVDFDAALPAYQELNAYAVDQAFEAPIVFVGGTWAARDGIVVIDDGRSVPTVRQFGVSE
ncbi:ABC transporter substrate-binding protein [Microbacterium trichothecenolyticum]|jgi:peptide/nickel transport system substrate-binding protein|uniref:ABC transporter substrate-binding protein n=1 Tax=Microbacterium trichothecenolyticum TaxID=69370 RepID=UPI0035BE1E51